MDIVKRLPYDVQNKIKFHFKHPCATMIEKYWKEPEVLKQRWVLAQLNRYNWLIHSVKFHNFGKHRHLSFWNVLRPNGIYYNAPLSWKLQLHNVLDPHGYGKPLHNLVIAAPHMGATILINHRRKLYKKLWTQKRGISPEDHNEWIKRSLYGGIYPVNKRPKVYPPRNPFTNKWNIRWKKNSILHKLYYQQKWNIHDGGITRLAKWTAGGTLIRKINGNTTLIRMPRHPAIHALHW